MPDDITVDDLLAEIAPSESIARVLLRQDLIARHVELDQAMDDAIEQDRTENRDPVAPVLAAEIVALEAEIEAAKREFRFRAIGNRKWADLLAAHPPTKEQRDKLRIDHNPDTFPVAAIAASCVSPPLTVEQVEQFADLMNSAQWAELWVKCCEANVGLAASPKSVVAGSIVRANAALGATASLSASLDRSSSAG